MLSSVFARIRAFGQWGLVLIWLVVDAGHSVQAATMQEPKENAALVRHLQILTQDLVGEIGIAAQRLGGGEVVLVNSDESFPMASTYKVPIAITVLQRVDRGELRLDQMINVPDESVVFSRIIASAFHHSGVALSVANLLEVMMTFSDNTATDICLELAGGPDAVNQTLRELGIEGLRVDRSTAQILNDAYGVEAGREHLAQTTAVAVSNPGLVNEPNAAFEADPRDQSSPRAMLSLLMHLRNGEALSASSTDFLLGAMSRTVTKPDRLGLLLPQSASIYHKTGTIGGVVNEVGYIGLPNGDQFALVVFTKSSTTPPAQRERALAEVARTLYDFYALLELTVKQR